MTSIQKEGVGFSLSPRQKQRLRLPALAETSIFASGCVKSWEVAVLAALAVPRQGRALARAATGRQHHLTAVSPSVQGGRPESEHVKQRFQLREIHALALALFGELAAWVPRGR